MNTFSRESILERVEEQNVKFLRLQFTSVQGFLKNIAVTVEQLQSALEGRVMFDSSVVEGFIMNKESDIYLVPDPATFVVFPWRPREGAVARLICNSMQPDGTPFDGCPRVALQKVLKKYFDLGYELKLAAEIEFYLFHVDEHGHPIIRTHDMAGYCDLTPVDRGENARRDMVLTLQEMDFDVSTSFHNIGPGQHEIFFKADSALAMADNIATFKFVVRTIAQRHGLHASFMPRPLDGQNGSGLNLHISLLKEGKNLFDGIEDEYPLGIIGKNYMSGILEHAKAITALANPVVNSYKRLTSGDSAPSIAAWSRQNRSTMIRVPEERGEGARIMLRSPDPSSNPYLVLAACLSAGLDGIEKGFSLPLPLDEMSTDNRVMLELTRKMRLPVNLEMSLIALSQDQVIRNALGERIYNSFITLKEDEWSRYRSIVHQWEIDEYLDNY